jgi:hypothetical protein
MVSIIRSANRKVFNLPDIVIILKIKQLFLLICLSGAFVCFVLEIRLVLISLSIVWRSSYEITYSCLYPPVFSVVWCKYKKFYQISQTFIKKSLIKDARLLFKNRQASFNVIITLQPLL